MAGEFEQPHYTDYGEELKDVGILQVRSELLKHQVDVETECRHVIYNVNGCFDEFPLVGRRNEPDEELKREPGVADALDVEESLVGVCLRLVQCPR